MKIKLSSRTLLVLAILFFSGNFVLGRAVSNTIPPVTLTYIRWSGAFLLFLPVCRRQFKEYLPLLKSQLWVFMALGMSGMIGFNIFQYWAVKYTTAINANIINAATPMFTAVATWIFLREKLAAGQVAGILLAFLGVLTIITRMNILQILSYEVNSGDLLMVIAVIINTFYIIFLRKKGGDIPLYVIFSYSVLTGLLVAWPLPLLELYTYGYAWIYNLNYYHYLSLLYFAVFPSILSLIFFSKAILDIGPVKTSIYQNLGIVFTSILGIAFLGEGLNLSHILGGILIVYGVWLTNTRTAERKKEQSQ